LMFGYFSGGYLAAIAAKYPPEKYPNIKGFYSKLLAGRESELDAHLVGKATPRVVIKPKKAPAPSDYSPLTAKEAQALQDALPPPWSGPERMGLRYYTGNSTVANGLLRGWIHPPGKTATDRKKIEAAQRNIEQAKSAMRPSTQPLLVYRSSNAEQFNVATLAELASLEGHILQERGFTSTTTNKKFHLQGKVKMEIEMPEGTPMAFVKSVSKYPHEDEVLLPPGMRYQVISVIQGRGKATVRVRVVPA